VLHELIPPGAMRFSGNVTAGSDIDVAASSAHL
jgi:hypothetical protein